MFLRPAVRRNLIICSTLGISEPYNCYECGLLSLNCFQNLIDLWILISEYLTNSALLALLVVSVVSLYVLYV